MKRGLLTKNTFKNPNYTGILGVVLLAATGAALLFAGNAATPVNNALEAESGVVAGGATVGADTNASGGEYVTFAAPVVTGNSLVVDASRSIAPFDRKMKGIGLANWTFINTWGKPYVGQIQGLQQLVKSIDPGIIRYAGGLWSNYVGFERAAAQRPPQTDWVKNGQTYAFSYGTDELKSVDAFAKAVNADVMIEVNVSSNDPAMWADLAAYARDNNLTSIKYYELSNELDLETFQNNATKLDPATYATRVAAYQKAILAINPNAIIVGGVPATASDIMRNGYGCCGNQVSQYITQAVTAAKGAGKELGAASFHWYQTGDNDTSLLSTPEVMEWTYGNTTSSPDWWRESYSRNWSEKVGPWIKANALGSSVSTKIGVSELGVDSSSNAITYNGNFTAALWYSDVLGRLAYNNINWVTQWNSYASSGEYFSLMYPDSDQTTTPTLNIRPSYYAYVMYSKFFGDQLVQSTTYDPTKISVWASTDSSDPGKLKLRITNLTGSAITTPIVINGFSPKTAKAYVLLSTNPTDASPASVTSSANVTINGTKLNAANVDGSIASIAGKDVTISGTSIQTTFPAYSSTAIVVSN